MTLKLFTFLATLILVFSYSFTRPQPAHAQFDWVQDQFEAGMEPVEDWVDGAQQTVEGWKEGAEDRIDTVKDCVGDLKDCVMHDILSLGEDPCPDGNCMTAIGKVNTKVDANNIASQDGFIGQILRLTIGIAGGIALILMLYGFFLITTSNGIPDKVTAGKEVITSAIMGLIMIILATVFMTIISKDILNLPGIS